jgi:hypothetical protein
MTGTSAIRSPAAADLICISVASDEPLSATTMSQIGLPAFLAEVIKKPIDKMALINF